MEVVSLSSSQQYRLKKQLIEFILDSEFQYLQNKEGGTLASLHETPFTEYCFNRFVKNLPFIKKDESLWIKLDDLLSAIKGLRLSSAEERGKKATKSDRTLRRFKILCTLFYTRALKTTCIHNVEESFTDDEFEDEEIIEVIAPETQFKEIQHENQVLDSFTHQLSEEKDGRTLRELFQVLKKEPNIQAVPEKFRQMIHSAVVITAYKLYVNFHVDDDREENLSMLKLLYNLTPFNVIRGIVKMSNPSKLIKYVLAFLFKRPFGAKSVLQRVIERGVAGEEDEEEDISDMTEKSLSKKELKKIINNKKITEKIHNFVNNPDHPAPHGLAPEQRVAEVLCDESIEPHLSKLDVSSISGKKENAVYQLLVKEIRKRDMELVSDFLGEDKAIETIEAVLEAFYDPLLRICQKANVADFLKDISNFMHDIKETASDKKQSKDHLIENYKQASSTLFTKVYGMLHNLVAVDNEKIVESLFDWFMDNYYPTKTHKIDLEGLVTKCIPQQFHAELINEVNELIKYKKIKREEKVLVLPGLVLVEEYHNQREISMPSLRVMPSLTKPFLVHVKTVLDNQRLSSSR